MRSIRKLLVLRRDQRLLPALPVADLGHRAGDARADGSGRRRRRRAPAPRRRLAARAADPRGGRRLGRAASGPASGRLGLPVPERLTIPTSTTPPSPAWRCCAPAAPTAIPRCTTGDRPRDRMGRRHAEQERRLGRLRCRQHALLPEPHPLRRSRRVARSADGRCERRAASASWRRPASPATIRRSRAASPICSASRSPTAPGSAAGAPTTSTAPGRRSAPSTPAARTDASPYIRKAVDWLKNRQRADGGWGEGGETYWKERRDFVRASTPSQTAWAVLGLMASAKSRATRCAAASTI